MTTPRATAISGSTITAIALGAVAVLAVAILIPGLKVLGLLLGLAALVVGAFSALNARRAGAGILTPAAGAALGAVAVVWFLVWLAA